MARVIISCREMKLELTTVTSQPNQPRNPTVQVMETRQTNVGRRTQ